MELEKFISLFANQFEDTDTSLFNSNTKFKELEEWSSLQALLIIGLVDEEYNIRIKGDDFTKVSSIGDLYQLIEAKQ